MIQRTEVSSYLYRSPVVARTVKYKLITLSNLTEGTMTVFGIMVDTCLKALGTDSIQLQFVKRVCTWGKINKPTLDRLALELFAFSGFETLCYDNTVLANNNIENKKYKQKNVICKLALRSKNLNCQNCVWNTWTCVWFSVGTIAWNCNVVRHKTLR